MSPPLPRYQPDTDPHKLDRIIDTTPELITTTSHTAATLPGDTRKLRGIPVQAMGVGGTSPGTDPHNTTVNRERYKARRSHRA